MNILSIAIIAFVVLETSNVLMLYFMPGTKKGNGVGVFNAYDKSKKDPEVYAFVKYLINWIAGTKLIFIVLLLVILFTGDYITKVFSVGALIVSIFSFFWRLYPGIKKMDKDDQISPKGYSKTLGFMIACFIGLFTIALFLFLVLFNKS
jgi:hypothetical protein